MYLLDTHVLLWAINAPERLSDRVRQIIESKQTKASVVSLWEMVLKKARKDTPVNRPVEWWDRYITRASVEVRPIRARHIIQLDSLPDLHRDPFDRMLVAQAQYEHLEIVSSDKAIARYVQAIW